MKVCQTFLTQIRRANFIVPALVILALSSCARHDAIQIDAANHAIDSFQISKSVQSDQLWTDRLIFDASESLKTGKVSEALTRLQTISNSIEVVQLTEDGVDCVEPLLLDRDKTMQKLVKFSEQLRVDANLIRFVPIEEKRGFLQAMIVIVNSYRDQKPKA